MSVKSRSQDGELGEENKKKIRKSQRFLSPSFARDPFPVLSSLLIRSFNMTPQGTFESSSIQTVRSAFDSLSLSVTLNSCHPLSLIDSHSCCY